MGSSYLSIMPHIIRRISCVQMVKLTRLILKSSNRLEADARTDLKDIAEECSLTPSAIVKRVKKLKATKIIVGTHLDLKRGVLGYPQEATIGITAENSRVDQIAQKVGAIPNVMVCAKSIGTIQFVCSCICKGSS